MGILSNWVVCPICRQKGAKKTLWSIKCPNPHCIKYDSRLIPSSGFLATSQRKIKNLSGNFEPGPNAITIRYRNYLGEDRTYEADRTTLRTKGEYITVCVVPTGKRIAFNKRFIGNLKEIEDYINSETIKELESQLEPIEVKIVYRNFKNQERIFIADANSIKSKGERISIRAIPSGKEFFLKTKNLENLTEIKKYIKTGSLEQNSKNGSKKSSSKIGSNKRNQKTGIIGVKSQFKFVINIIGYGFIIYLFLITRPQISNAIRYFASLIIVGIAVIGLVLLFIFRARKR